MSVFSDESLFESIESLGFDPDESISESVFDPLDSVFSPLYLKFLSI